MTTLDIVPYDAQWPLAFIEERDRIAVALGPLALRIESLKRHLSYRYDAGHLASQQANAEAKGSYIAAVTELAVAQGYPRTATTP